MSMNERQIKSQMKVGAGLALFGLVCPFFWISLVSGSSRTRDMGLRRSFMYIHCDWAGIPGKGMV